MIRRLLYGCCACLVVIVLWGFHFYSPFTYGHVALSSAEINRRKWLKTWDMLSHPNTWHTLLLVPNLLLLQTSFVAQKPKGSGNQTKTCVAMLHPGNFWETGHKQSATQGCLGLFGYKKKDVVWGWQVWCVSIEGKKTLKTSLTCCIILFQRMTSLHYELFYQHFDLFHVYPNNPSSGTTEVLEERKKLVW